MAGAMATDFLREGRKDKRKAFRNKSLFTLQVSMATDVAGPDLDRLSIVCVC